jgi:DNA modification methylase
VGSGSTCIAALMSERHFIGYDRNRSYVKLAEKRIMSSRDAMKEKRTLKD